MKRNGDMTGVDPTTRERDLDMSNPVQKPLYSPNVPTIQHSASLNGGLDSITGSSTFLNFPHRRAKQSVRTHD